MAGEKLTTTVPSAGPMAVIAGLSSVEWMLWPVWWFAGRQALKEASDA